jgi:RNA polymerase sigma-70 factor (ECF subfamily)
MTPARLPSRAPAGLPAPDADLLRALAEGNLRALGDLYDRYARDVWRAARRVSADGNDVDDVVHAVFIKLPAIAASYDGRASCRAWLCGIAVRFALRHQRGTRRFRRMLASLSQVVTGRARSDPEREAGSGEELGRFERALARLSEKKRAAFVLVELEGLSAEEAGRALDVPAATVRTRLFHARRELHEAMRDAPGGRGEIEGDA